MFSRPTFMPVDPEMVKNIMQKDFQYFVDRGFYHNEKDDPLSAHLFAIGGQKWRNLRTKLTPTFTSGKMKTMFDTLVNCSTQMQDAVDQLSDDKQAVDIKDVLGCFTTDVIGSCAFGIECNSFTNPNAEFRRYGKKIFDPITKLQALRNAFAFSNQKLAQKLGISIWPRDVTHFFMNVVKDTVKFRETNNFVRKDMLQLMIELKNNPSAEDAGKHDGKALTIEEVAAQAFVFFIAGFETSSTTMTFCLYELAANPDIQQRVRDEIIQVLAKHNGKITYDAIMEMKYMGQVVDETLRKYPPLSFLTRECVKEYQIPNTYCTMDKGTRVIISVLGLHHDPDHFPDPEKFDPERFSDENKQLIRPFTYLPFGEGPRLCLGMRFGMMQTKVGLTVLLKNYLFSVNKKTKVPFVMDRFSFILTNDGGIWLDIKKVDK